jgi:spore maturation protein CgeB
MNLCIFGLTISSSWGNGHATLWRGLCRQLARLGHRVTFFERDVSYYSRHRDLREPDGCRLCLYRSWPEVEADAAAELDGSDVAMVTSYCPDAIPASQMVSSAGNVLRVFYDLDAPVTLASLEAGEPVDYLPREGLADFDLVLSFTGGRALAELSRRLGARRVAPLYGSVDPDVHQPRSAVGERAVDLSYLATYAADRQDAVDRLFLAPARRLPERSFLLGGSLYPAEVAWPDNVERIEHVPPGRHPAFFASSRLTLNATRSSMARMGYCPSGRLFEAAACGAAIVSDWWQGLDEFFEPGREILVARSTDDVLEFLARPDRELAAIGAAARRRALTDHTAERRARQMIEVLECGV